MVCDMNCTSMNAEDSQRALCEGRAKGMGSYATNANLTKTVNSWSIWWYVGGIEERHTAHEPLSQNL